VKIPSLLKSLLLIHDSLSIPGFCKFVSKPQSAKINLDKGEIIPPTKEVSVETVAGDDTMLFDALIAEGYTAEDANKEINDFVQKISKELKENHRFLIDGFGTVYKGADETYSFKPLADVPLSADAISMKSVKVSVDDLKSSKQVKPVSKEKTTKEKEKKVKVKEIKEPKVKKEKTVKTKKEKDPNTKAKRVKVLKTTLIIVPIVAILVLIGFFYKPIFDKIKTVLPQKDTTEVVNDNKIDTIIPDNTNNNNNNSSDFGDDEEYRKFLDAKISSSANVYLGNNYKKFYIVVNSFQSEEYAENYRQQLRTNGYNPEIINGSNYYRVTIGSYNTVDNLVKDYNHYKSKFSNEIWVLVNRP